MIREPIANTILNTGRSIGRTLGLELAVVVDEHSLTIKMVKPQNSTRDWDPSLFKSGNLFFGRYANPIKPYVQRHIGIDELDEVDVDDSSNDDESDDSGPHVGMKSSQAYVESIEHNAVSQLLNPKERWQLLAYGMLALGILQFIIMIVILYSSGAV